MTSQESLALRRRLARLQADTNKQSALLEAAQSGCDTLQSVVCELTAEVERLRSVHGDLHDRLASADAARALVEVTGHLASCLL